MGKSRHCHSSLELQSLTQADLPLLSTSPWRLLSTADDEPSSSGRQRSFSIHVLGSCWGLALLVIGTIAFFHSHGNSYNNHYRLYFSGDLISQHQQHYPNSYLRSSTNVAERYLAAPASTTATCDKDCCSASFPCSASGDPGSGWINGIPLPVQILLIIFLIASSALFAGLTLGLMSLDKTGLEIVMSGDDIRNAEAAKRIYPVRKNGNLLLCTLLFGNVAINTLLSILLADKTGGVVGFVSSTFLILIFGEIIPQAACSRYPLAIGSATVPIVRVIIVLFYPITAPLAFVLNKALGREVATTYNQSEMLKLLQIHVQEEVLDKETAEAMTGALKYKNIPVKQVMTSLEHTFMINVDEKLNFEMIAIIFKMGYSRIPVYEISKNNIIGLLFVKDLIFVDPEDETPVRSFIQIFGRNVHTVWPDDRLGEVLRELKTGRSHMAIVRDVNNSDDTQDPFYEIKGIITLEDIIEEIIGDEIVDETDAFVDGSHLVKVNRNETFDWGRLRLLDSKIVDERLSYEESRAVTAHLRTNHAQTVALLTDHQLHRFVAETSVVMLPTAERQVGQELPVDLLYLRGVATNICTLVLAGKVTVLAGAEKFRSDLSAWAVLGGNTLTDPLYRPDFTAFVSNGPCRCLQFTREQFAMAVDASTLERQTLTKGTTSTTGSSGIDIHDGNNGHHIRTGSEAEEDVGERHVAKSRRIKLIEAIQTAGRNDNDTTDEAVVDNADDDDKNCVNEGSVIISNTSLQNKYGSL